MKERLPQEFVLRREVYAIELFGGNRLQRIPLGSVILADRPSAYVRMIEILWEGKRYIVYERDLEERMERIEKPEPPPDPPGQQESTG